MRPGSPTDTMQQTRTQRFLIRNLRWAYPDQSPFERRTSRPYLLDVMAWRKIGNTSLTGKKN